MAVPFSNNGKLEGCVTAIYPALTDGKSVVTLKTTDGWVPVPFSKVMYLEAKDKKTYVNAEELTGTHKYCYKNSNTYFRKIHLLDATVHLL